MACSSRIRKSSLHLFDELLAKTCTDVPYLFVRDLVYSVSARLVIVMCLELLAEYLCMNLLPLRCSLCRIVDTVGDVAYMKLLREIARPHVCEDVLADLAMEP